MFAGRFMGSHRVIRRKTVVITYIRALFTTHEPPSTLKTKHSLRTCIPEFRFLESLRRLVGDLNPKPPHRSSVRADIKRSIKIPYTLNPTPQALNPTP